MQLKRCFKPAALAVAAGLTMGAAHAQSSVTLYGQVDAWV
ncbi:porin, partial [Ralstonia solanacearum]